MAGDEAHLVADAEPVRRARYAEPAVLVGGALIAGGGLVGNQRRARVESQRLEARIDDRTVLRRGLITVAHTKRLGSKALVGAPSRSRSGP
jgi:hypothetical protein